MNSFENCLFKSPSETSGTKAKEMMELHLDRWDSESKIFSYFYIFKSKGEEFSLIGDYGSRRQRLVWNKGKQTLSSRTLKSPEKSEENDCWIRERSSSLWWGLHAHEMRECPVFEIRMIIHRKKEWNFPWKCVYFSEIRSLGVACGVHCITLRIEEDIRIFWKNGDYSTEMPLEPFWK